MVNRTTVGKSASSAEAGFTLIELMITVAILGVLSSVAIPSYRKYMDDTRHLEGIEYVSKIANGAIAYYQGHEAMPVAQRDNAVYPTASGYRFGYAYGPGVNDICNPDPAFRAARIKLYFHSAIVKDIFVWDQLMFQPEGTKLRYHLYFRASSTAKTANGYVYGLRPRHCSDLTKGYTHIRIDFRREGGVLRKIGPRVWQTG